MADEVRSLVTKSGGVAISAPSMREVPLESNAAALAFAADLLAGRYDVVVFLTGVGTRHLFAAMETRSERAALVAALAKTTIVARGPKPLRALRELGIEHVITVPEPNTWHEVVATVQKRATGASLAGTRIAIQEYGATNDALVEALRGAGASVETIPVYRWALPDDCWPLASAIREIIARTADVVLFTSATQVHNVMRLAAERGLADDLHEAFAEVLVASIGPVCSEALAEHDVQVDLEPTRAKVGVLVREAADCAATMVTAKRAALHAGRVRATERDRRGGPSLDDCAFLRACRREPVDYTPVWLMRQAGRYMQEYREVRARVSFMELCKRPELAAEVAVTAQERIGADAAILFSDILLIVEPMGLGLEYTRGEGPRIGRIVHTAADVDRLRPVEPEDSLSFVFEAVRATRRALASSVPLLGFSGAPFTLASYILEGGGSRNYVATKRFMYSDEGAWNAMMALIADAVGSYLRLQIEAGCQAVQLFDSWVGCLAPEDYERYVLPHTRRAIAALPAEVPVIHFGTETATLLDLQAAAGGSVLGVDHRVPIAEVARRHPDLAIQGNLDPTVLFTDRGVIREHVARLLDQVGQRPGHIFNLGHGILPATPVDNVIALVDAVHEMSEALRGGHG